MEENQKLLPLGAAGELYVGGEGVARGYLNRPELTREKFVETPDIKGERLYRSGDLVRLTEESDLEYLGRIDHQVKIRGFRVELGEIESLLSKHPRVKEAVVVAREEENNDKYLCAYVVTKGENENVKAELREYLSKVLPDYMIPSYFETMEKIPLTPNGKVNRNALPEPEPQLTNHFLAPRNKTEEKLVEIWAEVLSLEKEKISITENFFNLGGHSLKATLMIAKIHKEFQVKLPLTQVFKTPNPESLSAIIKDLKKEKYASVEHVEKKDYYGLSSAQKRFYLGWKMQPESISYNLTQVLEMQGKLQTEKIHQVFHQLINRHETLRTSFREAGGEPVQVIHEEVKFEIENYQVEEKHSPLKRKSIEGTRGLAPLPFEPAARGPRPAAGLISSFIRPFDLSSAPLLRVELARTGQDEHVFMMDMHHIISDAVSMAVMVKEMMSIFRGEGQPRLKLQYKDYTCWQDKMIAAGQTAGQETYWLNQFSGPIPSLDFPTDYPRPTLKNPQADILFFQMNPGLTSDTKQLAVQTGATLSILLMAVLKVLLFKYTGREDIVVGTGVAGRTHTDLENLIGIFINLLPLRSRPSPGKTFKEFLAELRKNALDAYENQDYPFEELVNKLGIPRQAGRHPLFEIEFTFQNVKMEKIEIPGLTLKPYNREAGRQEGKFDITLQAVETAAETGGETREVISFTLLYLTAIFKPSTMETLVAHFLEILGQVLENPHIKLQDIVLSIESSDAATAFTREDYEEFEF
jgi:acyl carrier protein